jgi:hypothetical protein
MTMTRAARGAVRASARAGFGTAPALALCGRSSRLDGPATARRPTRRAAFDGALDNVVVAGALAASVAGIAGSTLYALAQVDARGGAAARRASGAAGGDEDDGFRWGVMGAIACLPLFNWLARSPPPPLLVGGEGASGRRRGGGGRCQLSHRAP